MDSVALAWWKRPACAITIDYGQLAAESEIAASTALSQELGMRHHVLRVDAGALGSGDMAGATAIDQAPASDWWPYRNQFLITVAAMRAIVIGVNEILLGTVASDESHVDGTENFVEKIDALMVCQEGGLRVRAPAIRLSTEELVRVSGIPMSSLAWAHSCHKANVPCGQCRGCNKYYHVLRALQDGPKEA
jgi:7-cyano-7-deazaguanine synthase